MSTEKAKKLVEGDAKPPLGLSPVAALAINFAVVALTGYAFAANDPMQELMKAAGRYSDLPEIEEDNAIKSIIGYGMSAGVASGLVVGIFLDFAGPKITGLCGLGLQIFSFLACFVAETKAYHTIGAIAGGTAYQAISSAHFCICVLFPNSMSLALAIMGSAPDISLFVPQILLKMSESLGVKAVVMLYVILLGLLMVVDTMILPILPYSANKSLSESQNSSIDEEKALVADSEHVRESIKDEPMYWSWSTTRVLFEGVDYWVFLPLFIFSFARKKHFTSNARAIFKEATGEESGNVLASFLNNVIPLGFLAGTLWGHIADKFGVIYAMLFHNLTGCVAITAALSASSAVQYVAIIFFVVNNCYVFGILFAFLATYYGFANLGTLKGIVLTLTGLVSQFDNSYFALHRIMVALGCAFLVVPIYLALISPPAPPIMGPRMPNTTVFERELLSMLHTQSIQSAGSV